MPRPRKVTDEALKDELDREKLRELQLRNDEREGILVIAAQVDSRWTQFLADLRTHLEALPARLAGSVETPPPVLSALRERIEEIVEDLGATKAKRTRKPLSLIHI